MFENEGQESTQVEQPSQESTQTEASPTEQPNSSAQALIDLDSVEKFKFDGREMTLKDLRAERMMQADYTRKTTEISQERKYYDNLKIDLDAVKSNPSLAARFKAIYPEKFHHYLGYVAQPQASQGQNPQGEGRPQMDQAVLERIERIEAQERDRNLKAINAELDSKFKTLSGKYPLADEDLVIARAQQFLQSKRDQAPLSEQGPVTITDKEWDQLWKSSHDRIQSVAEKHYADKVNKQKNANAKGKDAASGGGIPGSAPNKPRTIKEAGAALIASGALDH